MNITEKQYKELVHLIDNVVGPIPTVLDRELGLATEQHAIRMRQTTQLHISNAHDMVASMGKAVQQVRDILTIIGGTTITNPPVVSPTPTIGDVSQADSGPRQPWHVIAIGDMTPTDWLYAANVQGVQSKIWGPQDQINDFINQYNVLNGRHYIPGWDPESYTGPLRAEQAKLEFIVGDVSGNNSDTGKYIGPIDPATLSLNNWAYYQSANLGHKAGQIFNKPPEPYISKLAGDIANAIPIAGPLQPY